MSSARPARRWHPARRSPAPPRTRSTQARPGCRQPDQHGHRHNGSVDVDHRQRDRGGRDGSGARPWSRPRPRARTTAVGDVIELQLPGHQHRQRDAHRPVHGQRRPGDERGLPGRRRRWRPTPRSPAPPPHHRPGRPRCGLADQHRHGQQRPVTSNQDSETVTADPDPAAHPGQDGRRPVYRPSATPSTTPTRSPTPAT